MPQWLVFNSGNWMWLEINVRNFSSQRRLDLEVFTGVHGQASLSISKNESRSLFLNYDGQDNAIAVPRFYWKIIYDPVSQRGTAFVGLNEPHVREIQKDMFLCDDITQSADFSWLTWRPRNLTQGFSYVCSIDQLRTSVPGIPKLEVVGLLS